MTDTISKSVDEVESSRMESNTTNRTSSVMDAIIEEKSSYWPDNPRSRFVENFIVIWLDSNIDACRNSITQLQRIINTVKTFSNADECVDFLSEIEYEKVFMIVSNALGQLIVPTISDFAQLYLIYVICDEHVVWTKKWRKIKGVFNQIEQICDVLKRDVRQCANDLLPISIISSTTTSVDSKDKLHQSFMYTQLLKEIILEIEYETTAKMELVRFCREQYQNNARELDVIDEFERDYDLHSPIWWYTRECFTYWMLNRALRSQHIEIILKMAFFIRDLNLEIERLNAESSKNNTEMIVYRGQGLSDDDFNKLKNSKGGLFSWNSFLSTSIDQRVSFMYADSARQNPDLVGILFRIRIDPSQHSISFAALNNISYFGDQEQEVIFSMHTVFRIIEIEQIENRLWQVEMILTSDNDEQLTCITEHLRKETHALVGWRRLGHFMITLGKLNTAQEIFEKILGSTSESNIKELAYLYHQLGYINNEKGDHKGALLLYQKTLEILLRFLPPNHPSLANTYNCIGGVHDQIGDYLTALSFYQKALDIKEKSIAPNNLSLARIYNNIGGIHGSMGDYSNALLFYQKTLKIQQDFLPSYHPDLATTYRNIGESHDKMGDYSNALDCYKKTLEIQQRFLPVDHPSLAITYNNISEVHKEMGDYSSALSFQQKTLEIQQKSLSMDHPNLAIVYGNVGSIHAQMGDYLTALNFQEKSLEIEKKSLPPHHPSLASTHNRIGGIHSEMGDYTKALLFHRKALEIQLKSLSLNHPSFASTYHFIASAETELGNYTTALEFYQKALEIEDKTLPSNHPDLAKTYNNIGQVHDDMEDYSTALSFYQKALQLQRISLPPYHTDLATTYSNIGGVYDEMEDLSTALSFYQKTLEIEQKILSPNHPSLATTFSNIGGLYDKMKDFSMALSFYEKTLEIDKNSLPNNHPSLAITYNNIGQVHEHMEDYSTALSLYQKTLDIEQKSLSPNHPSLATTYNNIARTFQCLQRYHEAAECAQKALEISRQALGPTHPKVVHFQKRLDKILQKL